MGEQNLFPNSREDITAEGKRHRGAVIGSKEYRDEYVNDLVKDGTTKFCQRLQKHHR